METEIVRSSMKQDENNILHFDYETGTIIGVSNINDKFIGHSTWSESPSPLDYSIIIDDTRIEHFFMDKDQLGYSIILEDKK